MQQTGAGETIRDLEFFLSVYDVFLLERMYEVIGYIGREIHGFENMKIERFIWHTFNLYPFVQKVPLHLKEK